MNDDKNLFREPAEMAKTYDKVCDAYAIRLCEMYDFDRRQCFWVSDEPGGVFCIEDSLYTLSMDEIKRLVDNNVPKELFERWWDDCVVASDYNPIINLKSYLILTENLK
jgi:hypothetical protein